MRSAAGLIAIVSAISCVSARANLLTNGSFENLNNTFVGDANSVDELNSGSSVIPGWLTVNGVPTAWIKSGNPYGIGASDGLYFLDLTGYADSGAYGGVSQTFATMVGDTYTVSFDLGYGGNSTSFGGPVSVKAMAGNFSGVFTSGSGDPRPAVWNPESFNFVASSSSTQLSIIGLSTAGGEYIGIDNASAVISPSAVPEPRSYTLLIAGLVGLIWIRRRFTANEPSGGRAV